MARPMTELQTRTWTLVLPYDVLPLSLNDRMPRRAEARIKADIRRSAGFMARAQKIPPMNGIHVVLHYRPKDNRRRDPDNCIATQKPAVDGLVDVGVVPDDDERYVTWDRPVIHRADEPTPGVSNLWLVITERTAQ